MKKTGRLACILLLSSPIVCAALPKDKPNNSAHSDEPIMRAVDRDWAYFKSVPCENLSNIVTHSDPEAQLLQRRRQQCLDVYKAFLPKPVNH